MSSSDSSDGARLVVVFGVCTLVVFVMGADVFGLLGLLALSAGVISGGMAVASLCGR